MSPEVSSHSQLSVRVLGLTLPNPFIVASGPLTDSLTQIRRALAAGAGGVVTKTVFDGELPRVKEKIRIQGANAFNSTTYSHVATEQWLQTVHQLASESAPVIVSVHASSPVRLAELARRMADVGASALELGICCPIDDTQGIADSLTVGSFTRQVRAAVEIPFSVKLTAMGDVLANVQAAVGEGADAISLSDSLPSVLVDVDECRLPLGRSAGYSGSAIKPIVLHAICHLRQSGISCPILGIGGVARAMDALEYIQVGANVVQLYTALMIFKLRIFKPLVAELGNWCARHNTSVSDQLGASHTNWSGQHHMSGRSH